MYRRVVQAFVLPGLIAASVVGSVGVLPARWAEPGPEAEGALADPWRPAYHFTPPAGWMNDPNGLIHFRGEHHLFYQHHPFGVDWGPMHWGHAVSRDLLRWRHLPIALAPDPAGPDAGGCFSGSAVDDGGVLSLVYTGHGPRQVQCLATSRDGRVFHKYAGNPVLAAPPEGFPPADFRDPKVWREGDVWRMVLGSEREGRGHVLLYESEDLRSWRFVNVVAASDGRLGGMWECPDLFPMGDRHLLLVSTTSRRNVIAFTGVLRENGALDVVSERPVDWGFDFFAAQSYADETGRRVVIGWMDSWASERWPTKAYGWAGAMSLPRTVELLGDGTPVWAPVVGVESLRGAPAKVGPLAIGPAPHVLAGVEGDALEIELSIEPRDARQVALVVRRSADGAEGTRVVYDRARGVLAVDRTRSGEGDGGVHEAPLALGPDVRLDLRVFVDRSSVEVFAGDGRVVITDRIYPARSSRGVALEAEDGEARVVSLTAWPLADVATAW